MKASLAIIVVLSASARADDPLPIAPIAPVTTAATDIPAHREAFAKAWREARACLVGEPQWDPDPELASAIQRAVDTRPTHCTPALDRALASARAGAEIDAGFHAAWFDVILPLAELGRGYFTQQLADADLASVRLGIPKPTAIATIPTLVVAPADVIASPEHAAMSMPVEHQIRIPTGDGRIAAVAPLDPPLGWTATVGDDDRILRVDGKVVATDIGYVAGTLGAGTDRAILVYAHSNISILRSHDGGAHWDPAVALSQRPPESYDGVLIDGRRHVGAPFDLVWRKSTHESIWQVIDNPTTLPAPHTIVLGDLANEASRAASTCVTNDALFWIEDGYSQRLGVTDAHGTRVLTTRLGYPRFLACANGRVIAATSGQLARCDATACEPPVEVEAAVADLDRAGHVLYISHGLGKGDKRVYVIAATATKPARVIRTEGWVVGLYAGTDDQPVLLVRVPTGIAKVHP